MHGREEDVMSACDARYCIVDESEVHFQTLGLGAPLPLAQPFFFTKIRFGPHRVLAQILFS